MYLGWRWLANLRCIVVVLTKPLPKPRDALLLAVIGVNKWNFNTWGVLLDGINEFLILFWPRNYVGVWFQPIKCGSIIIWSLRHSLVTEWIEFMYILYVCVCVCEWDVSHSRTNYFVLACNVILFLNNSRNCSYYSLNIY